MNSTPDEPVPSAEEPGGGDVRPPEPVEQPPNPYATGGASPADGQPQPGQAHPGQPHPGPPYPGQPHPGQPYPGQPYPGQQGQPGYAPAGWQPPVPPRRGLSFGAGLGFGLGIGVIAHGLAIVLMFASAGLVQNGPSGPLLFLWPFLLVAFVAVVMMFFTKTRSFATGILIIAATLWLLIIGPCIALLTGRG